MSSRRPFTIEIFVAEGLPDGLRLVKKSNWIGQGIVRPRGRYSVAKQRDEFSRSGVYLLVGQDGDQLPKLYVGEAEKVKKTPRPALRQERFLAAGHRLLNQGNGLEQGTGQVP